MLDAHGFPLDEQHEFESPDEEVVKKFLEVRGVTRLVEAGERVDPGDIGPAVAGYRNVYEYFGERYVAWARLRAPPAAVRKSPGRRFARPPPRGEHSARQRACLSRMCAECVTSSRVRSRA
jgi:hypothetical protein